MLPVVAVAGSAEKVRDGQFEFVVTKVTRRKLVGGRQFGLGQTAKGTFTIISLKVTNIGSGRQNLHDSWQYVYDASGRKFGANSMADLALSGSNGQNDGWQGALSPGNTVHGKIAFDMPSGVQWSNAFDSSIARRRASSVIVPSASCSEVLALRSFTGVLRNSTCGAFLNSTTISVPVMKRASAIVTNRGGRTCHAAIIARELGIPAVVGCGDATRTLADGSEVTVSCAEGDTGHVYAGLLEVDVDEVALNRMPACPTKIMMNVGNPELAFEFRQLPNEGVGLARLEFIIARNVGIHPKALLELQRQPAELRHEIEEKIAGYASGREFYVAKVAEGVATIAAAFFPKPVIVRLSDFKSNEYSNLLGGSRYEPHEENPMLGFRGASRYVAPEFYDCFELECEAMRRVRDTLGFTNVELMIPFVRTTREAERVIALLAKNGLRRGENGLRVIMMCEIPSNALLADRFLEYFDGFSIGSNDLTQLTLGVDRDAGGDIATTFDERDDAVKALLKMAIEACNRRGKYVGICGQGPSDHPDLAQWLVEQGIESISLNPDTVVSTWMMLAKKAAK
jgi:phosphoenolpyruvate synthase